MEPQNSQSYSNQDSDQTHQSRRDETDDFLGDQETLDRSMKYAIQIKAEEFNTLKEAVTWLNTEMRKVKYPTYGLKKNGESYLAHIAYKAFNDDYYNR